MSAMRDAMAQSFADRMESPDGVTINPPSELMAFLQRNALPLPYDGKQMFAANRG